MLCNRCVWGQELVLEVQHMVPLSSLRVLRLHSCAFVDELYLQGLRACLPQLQCLDLQGCSD